MGAALREVWLWLLLAFLLGLAIGYFLRQRPARERATTGSTATTRIAALEVQLEDRLKDHSPAALTPATAKAAVGGVTVLAASAPVMVVVPVKKAAARVPATTAPATRSAPRERVSSSQGSRKRSAKAAVLDLAAAKATLGVTVKLDDLKLIEGIGPKIETLFKADGITSWHELSKANVERLQGVLDAAGPRNKVHDPVSWPRQASLLATGKWADFKTLTDKLKDGR